MSAIFIPHLPLPRAERDRISVYPRVSGILTSSAYPTTIPLNFDTTGKPLKIFWRRATVTVTNEQTGVVHSAVTVTYQAMGRNRNAEAERKQMEQLQQRTREELLHRISGPPPTPEVH